MDVFERQAAPRRTCGTFRLWEGRRLSSLLVDNQTQSLFLRRRPQGGTQLPVWPRAARVEPDSLLDLARLALYLDAQGGAECDARVERNDVHRPVGAPGTAPVRTARVRRVWPAQTGERVKAETLDDR